MLLFFALVGCFLLLIFFLAIISRGSYEDIELNKQATLNKQERSKANSSYESEEKEMDEEDKEWEDYYGAYDPFDDEY